MEENDKPIYLTKEGLEKLKQEIEHLESVERTAISRQIGEARDKGDLSENAEYHAAKEAQSLMELKISKLKSKLMNARILDTSRIDPEKISVLAKVKLLNLKTNMEMTYELVPETESDFKKNKLSINTPIAKGLMGKKVEETVKVIVPSGEVGFKVLEIQYDF